MIISHRVKALRDIQSAVRFEDRLGSLTLYTTASVLCKELVESIEFLGEEEKPTCTQYLIEKLVTFRDCLESAVMPCPGDGKSPLSWLESASMNLHKVESHVAEFEA